MKAVAGPQIRFNKTQRLAFLGAILLLAGIEYYFHSGLNQKTSNPAEEKNTEFISLISDTKRLFDETKLDFFAPNELSEEEWQELGFSTKQSQTIIKYKYSLGGYFSNKEQIKECFVISERKFNELEPYMVFNDVEKYKRNSFDNNRYSKPNIQYTRFNPNDYSQKDWENIGFSPRQAETILKYKKRLGGKFTTLKEIEACFVISPGKFKEMKPYIILPKPKEKSPGTIVLTESELADSVPISEIEPGIIIME